MIEETTTMENRPIGSLMLDITGCELTEEDRQILLHPHVGGVIFFARNYHCYQQLTTLVEEIRQLRPGLLLAVDQEGGRVQRFQTDFTRLPPMQCFHSLYEEQPVQAIALARDAGWLMAAELLAVGIDFSFAPVLDVDRDHCSIIADRSFSPDPDAVAALGRAFIEGMHEAGMAATGKHFPGHGKVSGDSHLELPVDTRTWAAIEREDLKPFAQLASVLDAMMPAHIVFTEIDAQPVGFSPVWLQQILRRQLQFEGVIFSDDLSMEGATGAGGYGDRAEAALRAGCDMVLACNNRDGAREVLARLDTLNRQPSARLAAMRHRREWQRAQLIEDKRWQEAATLLQRIRETVL